MVRATVGITTDVSNAICVISANHVFSPSDVVCGRWVVDDRLGVDSFGYVNLWVVGERTQFTWPGEIAPANYDLEIRGRYCLFVDWC